MTTEFKKTQPSIYKKKGVFFNKNFFLLIQHVSWKTESICKRNYDKKFSGLLAASSKAP